MIVTKRQGTYTSENVDQHAAIYARLRGSRAAVPDTLPRIAGQTDRAFDNSARSAALTLNSKRLPSGAGILAWQIRSCSMGYANEETTRC